MIQRFLHHQMNRKLCWLLLTGLVVVRLVVTLCQRVFLMPLGAPLDDMLMLEAAMHITEGGWLGAYGAFAMAKNMGFAVWLAFLHEIGMPFLLGNTLFWVAACAFAAQALRPFFPGNLARLVLFAFLAFQPVSFAGFTMRVYRDAVFPTCCLLAFAGLLGFCLRLPEKEVRGSLVCMLGAGAGLAGAWLLREDGAVLLVFVVAALALALLYILTRKDVTQRPVRGAMVFLPLGTLAAGVLAFCCMNYLHFGVFLVNDLNGGAFPKAYGAMAAVSQGMGGEQPRVPVSQAALEALCNQVPSLAPLRGQLFAAGPVRNGFSNAATGEFGGSFYYALRLAAANVGLTPTAPAAQAYWQQVADEIRAAVDEGSLASAAPAATVLPHWQNSYALPAVRETAAGFWHLMTLQECNPRPQESFGTPEEQAELVAYLRTPVHIGFIEGTDQPYFNLLQRVVFRFCDLLIWIYRIVLWPLLGIALYQTVVRLVAAARACAAERRFTFGMLVALLFLGLGLSVLLRLVVAAYMEVASFGIGTYIMYLASAMPPLLLFCAGGAALPKQEAL